MRYSRYNIFSKIRESERYFLVNLLSGNADILTEKEAGLIKDLQQGKYVQDVKFVEGLKEKGYLAEEAEEQKEYRNRYLDFLDSRGKEDIQIFFVPGYSCNFACSYCYQDHYQNPVSFPDDEVINAFFEYIQKEFVSRRKYITVFGGEPLLPGLKNRGIINTIVEKSSQTGLELCFVTNGYTLEEYFPVLKKGNIREVQVTLDGTRDVHDRRRHLKDGRGTFDKIVRGIDKYLKNGININVRVVADRENIDNLPDLARFAISHGWTGNPLFKTQIGRNYELHHCQAAPGNLFSRVSLYEKIYELTRMYPHILEFHKPAYSISGFLSENGELPDPLFDSCPACKTEWAFDYTGKIYSCTATVGKSDESLGTFYPETKLNKEMIDQWESRDITSIQECRECSVQLACGGGCGAVAKNRSGNICSPDCRPVRELLEIGFSAYSL